MVMSGYLEADKDFNGDVWQIFLGETRQGVYLYVGGEYRYHDANKGIKYLEGEIIYHNYGFRLKSTAGCYTDISDAVIVEPIIED